MRSIGLVAMSVWLSACSTTPMFPPAVMKDVDTNTRDVKAWEDQAYHSSDAAFVPHKVELAGETAAIGSFEKGPIAVYRGRPGWLPIQACNMPKTMSTSLWSESFDHQLVVR